MWSIGGRSRVAVCLMFLSFGMIIGCWTARIPAIKHRLVLSDGQLSIGLLAFAAGCIAGMQLVGRLVDRYGGARLMTPVAVADAAMLVTPAYAPGLSTLAACLFGFGLVHGALNIAMNGSAVEVERSLGRPIMSSFHATYSVGGFVGAAVGALFAHADLSAGATFLAVAAVVLALAAWARGQLPRVARPVSPQQTNGPLPGVLFLGVLAFCCLVGEGAAADWSSVYLRDELGTSAGFAPAAYAAFAVLMTTGRLIGDRLAARMGPVALVRACGVLAAVGLSLALFAGRPVAGVVGFGCLGAGLSCIAPLVFSAAGNRNPSRAGAAIARVASMGYAGFLTGPILIGATAEAVGLTSALFIPATLALFVALAAGALRHRPSSVEASSARQPETSGQTDDEVLT
jgi:predicted MFS family arabinose efflux permease